MIIITIIVFVIVAKNTPQKTTSDEVAQCIGQNSIVYIQNGCHACLNQENLFGDSYKYLNVIDCFYTPEKCSGITATPTWVINGEKYIGVQSIDKLKGLTGC
jgi:hypothetical protein